jgi:hypothetical protein
LSRDDILQEENGAVRHRDLRLSIQRLPRPGGGSAGARSDVDVFTNHRTSANFSLDIPSNSALADRLEYPIRAGHYRNARAEGFYVLIKFNNPAVYRIRSHGFGARDYVSRTDYYIEIS